MDSVPNIITPRGSQGGPMEGGPRAPTGHTPLKPFDLFSSFNRAKDLMEEPALIEDETTVVAPPVLTEETKQRLSERTKRLSEGDVPTLVEEERARQSFAQPFAEAGNVGTKKSSLERQMPWARERGYNGNKWVGLHQELLDFIHYIRPTEAELALRNAVVMEITELCLRIWPGCLPRTFGSMSTQLMLPTSDIDICVSNVHEDIQQAITNLAEAIASNRLCSTAFPRVIRNTRVPLVKFTHAETGFSVDLSINSEEGVANTEIVRELLTYYPAAYTLIITIKFFLMRRRMHETYYGGLGSYGTTLLVLSFLQHHPCNLLSSSQHSRITLGMLLSDFFRYYGCIMNYTNVGIDVTQGGSYFRKKPSDTRGLLLLDPTNPENNVGSATRHIALIARSFEAAHSILHADVIPLDCVGGLSLPKTRLGRLLWMTAPEIERRENLEKLHMAKLSLTVNALIPTEPPRKHRKQSAKPRQSEEAIIIN